ncbi:MAG: Asp-tRNA(Asn)/Glu-tRNA(Gln) amidotransferase subunit GatA [Fimbriimonadaceae bacterium]|nr:Asp-tRNA(Asn)/Glu-tRNA(Gln) amidotransferase subunit GatA [Fimbriimonadaceae bacterium]
MSEMYELTIEQAAIALRVGAISSVELTQAVLDRLAATEPAVAAFIEPTPEVALAGAAAADARLRAGDAPLLCGIPGALKDLIATRGIQTTAGSQMLKGYRPIYDAHVTQRLIDAGYVLVGKTNLDEFAMGSSTETSSYQTTRNPFCPDCVPGGSSGGSAACVAAGSAFFSLGTDTGGSIRQPASLCGVVGMKPTYGRVSRWGVIAMASSLDQVGPFARTVKDCAAVLECLAGRDERDATSSSRAVPSYREACGRDIAGLKLGVPREYFIDGMEPAVEQSIRAAVAQLEGLGATAVEISLPHTSYALPTYYIIMPCEVSANLARFDGIRYGVPQPGETMWEAYAKTRGAGFGAEVKRRIMLGTYALSAGYHDAYYVRAQKVRTLIKQDFDQAFEQVDAIVCPASPTTAFPFGAKMDDPIQMYLSDVFTLAASLAGLPGLVVPCGFDAASKPIGLQLIAPHWREETLFQVAHAFEQSTSWSQPQNRHRLRVGQGGAQ